MARRPVPVSPEEVAALRAAPGTTLALDLTSAARRALGRNEGTFYTLFEGGVAVEQLEAEGDVVTRFESDRRTLDEDDVSDPRGVARVLVESLDAYVPDLDSERSLPERPREAETWRLVTPRLVLQLSTTEEIATTPTFTRVSYFWFPR